MSAAHAAEPGTTDRLALQSWMARVASDLNGLVLGSIICLAAGLRFYDLGGPSLWYDEIASLTFARQPLALLWSDWMLRETNPPLYYSLLHIWIRLFGTGEFSLRLPSALAGIAAVWLIYRVAADLGLKRAGLLAAFLATISSLQIYCSQEARAYIFAEVAALVAVLGLIRISHGVSQSTLSRQAFKGLILYLGSVIVALYLHTTMVALPIISTAIFAALWVRRRDRSWRIASLFVAANAACLLAWAWWLWISLQQMSMARPNFGWMTQPDPLTALAIATWSLMPRSPDFFAGLAPLALLVPAVLGAWQLRGDRRIILLGFLIGTPLLLYLLGFASPVLTPRTLLWAMFAAMIALSTACLTARTRALRLGMPALVIVLASWHAFEVASHRDREPWREIVAYLSTQAGPDGALVFKDDSIGLILDYYCPPVRCPFARYRILAESDGTERWAEGLWSGQKIDPSEVAGLFAGRREVWAVRRTYSVPAPQLWNLAREEFWRKPPRTMPDYLQITPWRKLGAT